MSESDQATPDRQAEGTARPAPQGAPTAGKGLEPVSPDEFSSRLEAALLSSDQPLTAARLAEALGESGVKAIHEAVGSLNDVYQRTDRSFRIEQVAGGLRIMTLPRFGDVLTKLHRDRAQSKLSPAALETLAVVAYKQPIMRAQIESIRGVACGEVLRSLMERRLIKIVGRAQEIGRPMLYGTTRTFQEAFGLANLKDLPKVEQLKAPA